METSPKPPDGKRQNVLYSRFPSSSINSSQSGRSSSVTFFIFILLFFIGNRSAEAAALGLSQRNEIPANKNLRRPQLSELLRRRRAARALSCSASASSASASSSLPSCR